MQLNDKERYSVRLSSLEAVYRNTSPVKEYAPAKWPWLYRELITVGHRHELRLQINANGHTLSYDDEDARNADHDMLSDALGQPII